METILKANRIPFSGLDLATDEKARMLWGRRAGKDAQGRQRKLPALVQQGLVVGVSALNSVLRDERRGPPGRALAGSGGRKGGMRANDQ